MRYRTLLFLLAGLFFSQWVMAQDSRNSFYSDTWKKADSLMDKGLPQSAKDVVKSILSHARKNGDGPELIKAELFLLNAPDGMDEENTADAIHRAESYLSEASGAEKAIWESITAEMYWNYYQQNRYTILGRATRAGVCDSDLATWDAVAFFQKTAALYQSSLADREMLQRVPVAQYAPLLIEGKNTRNLRPALYDLLVFRAIAFFQNDEKDLIRPAYAFEMDGPQWFSEASRFVQLKVKVKDTASFHFRALQLYQEAISFHLNDAKPDALIDADLLRLAFVYQYSVSPDKDSLYLAALQHLQQQYAGDPAVAEVAYRIAQQQLGDQNVPVSLTKKPAGKLQRNIPAVREDLKKIIAAFPGSEGGIHAFNLLQTLEQASLAIKTEEVNIPNENIRTLITYKNTANAYFRIFRVPHRLLNASLSADERLKRLVQEPALRAWSVALPGIADMELHHAEMKVDALPEGAYCLVASVKDDLSLPDNIIAVSDFQVSNLSLVKSIAAGKGSDARFYVLNRTSGQPVSGARLLFWKNRGGREPGLMQVRKSLSDALGRVAPGPQNDYASYITIISGLDTLQVNGYFGMDYTPSPSKKPQMHTFFFTDRSIYRPGQTIYFKGIRVRSTADGKKNEVVSGTSATVTFYDANGQKTDSVQLTTNRFGSFSGSFTAPRGGLTGMMHLGDDYGSATVSVEEYKRPKFYVAFDTLRDAYALNQQVHLKGIAKAYAGNNLDGATVTYRVVRRARFPYFWCFYRWGMPSSPEMEIANGTTETAADGSFALSIQTIPDKSVSPESFPVFTYIVYADVTDINGETHSGTVSVSAGYRSLQIIADVPEAARAGDLDTISLTTQNLNGIFIPAELHLTVAPLVFPGKIYRQRLWEVPDQFLMTESEFRNAFPDDAYKEESDYHNWKEGTAVFAGSVTTTASGTAALPGNIWKQDGWYVLTIQGKDLQGNDIVEKKYVYLSVGEGPAQKPFVVMTSREHYAPGDKALMWLQSGFRDVYLLENNSLGTDGLKHHTGTFAKDITDADLGGIAFSWLYVYHSRVYTVTKIINVPWSDKTLQLSWATHRDKSLPGAQETWTLTISGAKKEQVAAELLAGMYDASLDAFKPHRWSWDKLYPVISGGNWIWSDYGFGAASGLLLQSGARDSSRYYEKDYDRLDIPFSNRFYRFAPGAASGIMLTRNADAQEAPAPLFPERKAAASVTETEDTGKNASKAPVPIRTNLQETAFFFPQLQTDADGNVRFSFTLPEALTEWKLMAFAHTGDWKTGYLEGSIRTQKDLMVTPSLPRFLRQGDDLSVRAKISNLSTGDLSGTATLELLDAQTLLPVALPFRLTNADQPFSVVRDQSTAVSWTVHVPESMYTPVVVRVSARAGAFSDGEENTLPVLTNRMLVTETLPLPVRGDGARSFTLDKLVHQSSSTLVNRSLTFEFTANPAWYAVQSLPYLVESPYECAEQTFNRFYANALAAHIVAQSPEVAQIFSQWQEKDTVALLSGLEKNQELKSALLEETPWVLEARNETDQKHRIALLFETHTLARSLRQSLDQLARMQLPEGAFPWFKGMYSDRYITQYIMAGIGRLAHLQVEGAGEAAVQQIVAKALPYLDNQLQNDYDNLVRSKADMKQPNISYIQVHYLYMRSFFNRPVAPAAQKAVTYYRNQAARYWARFNPYMKGMIALALYRSGDQQAPQQIISSLKETASVQEETGMSWKQEVPGYWWYQAPLEAQSLLIEAFNEIAPRDTASIEEMKVWLLKQKQTQSWGTTKATADACYALLLNGAGWLAEQPEVTIHAGKETISSVSPEAGTGYFKQSFEGNAVTPDMGNITVDMKKTDASAQGSVAWGAVYWQYFEDMDKITSAETPLRLEKQLFIEQPSARGPVLTAVNAGDKLAVGDKVTVRITLHVDRDMEYVHLKDMRPACFEPLNVLSGYRYQGGLGYYESTKDMATDFFFGTLQKGTYVFDYPVFVTTEGTFSGGIATIQCMYAPEFSSHSKGIRVEVQ